ncbi:MAG: GNAT family N-acetyltransferase [Desulfobacteraceae bacterium]|nr:GNAT family N-acetyltransferase [Desulfobacteraceae bacterium]
MNFRLIDENDIKSCAELFNDVFSSKPWDEPWTKQLATKRLNHFYESKGFVGVLAEQDSIIGFALGNIEPFHFGSMFYLREMCTKTNLQKSGVGSKVLNALELELLSHGVYSTYLTTERDIPAASFYIKNGFIYSEKMGFYARCTNS